ncbi:helix-turn-helix domain-containing protein [candidate division KSB1 bacterium]|nr:helix-turn-helix domain-containing protein [candidate division KSB1 bacterium]
MELATKAQFAQEVAQKVEERWGRSALENGWTAFPNVILERQQACDLKPVDINVLMHILKYWWKNHDRPFPKKRTIAECIGMSESTVQRSIRKMEKAGLIQREDRYDKSGGRRSNYHHLDGLVKRANELGSHAKKVKEQRSKQDTDFRKSKRRPDNIGLAWSDKKQDAE